MGTCGLHRFMAKAEEEEEKVRVSVCSKSKSKVTMARNEMDSCICRDKEITNAGK